MERTRKSIDKYLAGLPDDVRADMTALDAAIGREMAGLPRAIWEGVFWGGSQQTIIGYGDEEYTRPRGQTVRWFKVGLALQKTYISVYVNAVADGKYVAEARADQLGKVKVGKSSVSFKRLADVKLPELLKIVAIARRQES